MSAIAIMEDATKTVITQWDPITAVAIVDGPYHGTAQPVQVEIITLDKRLLEFPHAIL